MSVNGSTIEKKVMEWQRLQMDAFFGVFTKTTRNTLESTSIKMAKGTKGSGKQT